MTWQIRNRTGHLLAPVGAAAFGCFIALAGCSSGGGSLSTGSLVNTVKGAFHGTGTPPITREDVKSIPFASLGYRVGDSAEEMLVLAGKEGGELVWTSSAKITVVTQNGRIVRTIGLQHDLRGLALKDGSAIGLEPGATSSWTIRFDDPDEATASLSCSVTSVASEVISILQRNVRVSRIDEACSSPDLRWRFENHYWIDPASRIVWQSEQHTHPRLKLIRTEVLRPYTPGGSGSK